MAEQGSSDGRIRFGAFEADLRSGELFNDGKRVPLANQSFVALATLLERPGELVSREELRRRLWPDNRVVEFDQGLNAIINRLREALAAAPGGAGLIETLPRRGYRFAGTLRGEAAEPAEMPRKRPVPRAYAYGLAAVFALAATAVVLLLTHTGRPEGNSLKVQPLTSLIGREVSPALTAKGERVLFAWDGDQSHFDLYSKEMDSERLLRLTSNPATALHAAWAPGGAQIALARQTDHDSGVYLIAPVGGSYSMWRGRGELSCGRSLLRVASRVRLRAWPPYATRTAGRPRLLAFTTLVRARVRRRSASTTLPQVKHVLSGHWTACRQISEGWEYPCRRTSTGCCIHGSRSQRLTS